jgi:hypothetical protein
VIFLAGPFLNSLSHSFAAYLTGVALITSGLGLVGKRPFGFVLFLISTVLVICGLFTDPASPEAGFVVGAWWVVPAILYYPRRWREFFGRPIQVFPHFQTPERSGIGANMPRAGYPLPVVAQSPPSQPVTSKIPSGPSLRSYVTGYSTNAGSETSLADDYRAAAEQGNAEAQNALGALYERGVDVPLDCNEAARWYRKAAEKKNPNAQHNLGLLYRDGRGVGRNEAEAYFWFHLATAGDRSSYPELFIQDRDSTAARLNLTDRAEVIKEADRWLAAHPSRASAQRK